MIDIQMPGDTRETSPEPTPAPEQQTLVVNSAARYETRQEGDARRGTTGYSRTVPWGTARHVKSHAALAKYGSAREALVATGMDWDVEKRDLFTFNGPEMLEVPDFKGVVRTDTGATLGVVKGRYEPWPNRRLAEFTDTLVSVEGEAVGLSESFGGWGRSSSCRTATTDRRPSQARSCPSAGRAPTG